MQANKCGQLTGRFDPELIDALPDSVRFISHNGAGYDQIDAIACMKKGLVRCYRALLNGLIGSFRHIRLKYARRR